MWSLIRQLCGILRHSSLTTTASSPTLVPTVRVEDPKEPLIRHADRAIGGGTTNWQAFPSRSPVPEIATTSYSASLAALVAVTQELSGRVLQDSPTPIDSRFAAVSMKKYKTWSSKTWTRPAVQQSAAAVRRGGRRELIDIVRKHRHVAASAGH
jgi:hypothetical protein